MLLSDYKCECGMTAEKKHRLTERPKVQCICGKFMVKQGRVHATQNGWYSNQQEVIDNQEK